MKNLKRFGAVAIALVMALAIAAPASANSDITVGEFIQQLARAKNVNASSSRAAADSLAAIGVFVPTNLAHGKILTEGDVSVIARSAGLNVRSANPSAPFDSAKTGRFFGSFGRELKQDTTGGKDQNTDGSKCGWWQNSGGSENEDEAPGGEDEGPSGKGKGKGKGKNDMTPTDPD